MFVTRVYYGRTMPKISLSLKFYAIVLYPSVKINKKIYKIKNKPLATMITKYSLLYLCRNLNTLCSNPIYININCIYHSYSTEYVSKYLCSQRTYFHY